MEKIEQLYEKGNYDSKNILNRSTKVIPQEVLDQIEKDGVTSEYLETLGTPVFKYKTQITIHGLFPDLKNNYIGGYKNLFQNKNLSIGVRYNAIDYEKKKHIYLFCHRHSGWQIHQNSTEFYIYKTSPFFSTKNEYAKLLPKMMEEIKHVNKDLFIGETGVFLSKSIMGSYFLLAFINVNAIKQENVIPLLENILGDIYPNILSFLKAKKEKEEKEEAERKIQREKERAEAEEKAKPFREIAVKLLTEAGFVYQKDTVICQNLNTAAWTINYDEGTIMFSITVYGKTERQKKWRYDTALNITPDKLKFQQKFHDSRWNMECARTTLHSGQWVRIPETKEVKKEEKPQEIQRKFGTGFEMVEILDYSEKAIAVVGEGTKAIKDFLKAAGGSFNFRLTCGPGWIFPKSRLEELQKLLKYRIENENKN